MSDMAKNLILWLVIAVVLMSVFQSFGPSESNGRKVDYSTFLQEVNQDRFAKRVSTDVRSTLPRKIVTVTRLTFRLTIRSCSITC
ncbi:ATP-dependent metallopeptidase FtsH/Yme1/Tma family protein [Klebsiella pneumoniae subsp. pneumoniae]|uniref:ATP-dependent metallopeptidase FtsH/Yme1/Tma family protein n=1 Tax=Klebsiella pneumoniae subsp. pneumoniae TaxID=72407 RepID=A0A7S9E0L4_KLEPN|nr:ATP-dependent metallopeptidase FtsH/Yme1/Tma family protein [Klebsiella pneumoniae subsp. pneumoniae]